ncbi:MAG TPA: sigma-70 family RNA polymerase sigma factor [Povalibacter sp.]
MLNLTLATQIKADYAGLVALFAGRLRDRALAEDVVNQAFVESLQKLASGRIADPGRFSGFVYGVAFNLLRNHRRRLGNRPEMRASDSALANYPSRETPFDVHSRECIAQHVRCALEQLPIARDREIIRRLYLEEQSKEAICQDLGLSTLNFDRIVFRARRRMRVVLEAAGVAYGDMLCDDATTARPPASQ